MKKIKAYSIVESAVAISVIATCLTIAVLVFSNSIDGADNFQSLKAQNTLDSLVIVTKENESYLSETIETANGKVNKTADVSNEDFIIIQFEMHSKDQKTYQKKLIVNQ